MLGRDICDLLLSPEMPTPIQRFWRFVKPQPNGCWLWCGAITSSGYGSIRVNGASVSAHVFSYVTFIGAIPHADLKVCHTCDNKRCVCPSHFYLGTHSENIKDAYKTGVRRKCKAPVRLTSEIADKVRTMEGTQAEIARAFGVSEPLVRAIKSGKVWDREKYKEQRPQEVPF